MFNENKLRNEVAAYLKSISTDKKKSKSLTQTLADKRAVLPGTVSGLLGGMDPISILSEEELFWFAEEALANFVPKDYYSETEIKKYSISKNSHHKTIFPIEFENCLQINDEQYLTVVSTQKLLKFNQSQVISYNLFTQRNPKVVTVNGKEQFKIRVNNRSVKEIKDLILNNRFVPNALTLNVKQDSPGDAWDYNESLGIFTLKQNGFDIIDGYHRYLAIIQAMREKPELNMLFPLYIMVFEEEAARRYIAQEDKRNKINTSYSKTLDTNRFETRVVNAINEDPESYFYGMIKPIGDKKIDSGKMITALSTLFKKQYDRSSFSQVVGMKRYLLKGLNDVLDADKDLEKDFSDTDMRVALYCLDKYFEDDKRAKRIAAHIKYFRKNKDKIRGMSISAIAKTIDESEVK